MIHLLLDTNIYRTDSKRISRYFESLSKLCKTDYVKLYVPRIVRDEFITFQTSNENLAVFAEAISRLKKIKRLAIKEKDAEYIGKVIQKLGDIKLEYGPLSEQNFDSWVHNNKGEYCEIKSHHGKKVIEAYFAGLPPFKHVKNREDFPDAFIYQTAIDIQNEGKSLSIISNDKNFCESFNNIANVSVYKSIEDFIKSEEIAVKLSDGFGEKYFDCIIDELKKDFDVIEKFIKEELINEIVGEHVKIEVWGDSTDAFVSMINETFEVEFDFKNAEYYSGGLIGIPFASRTDAYIMYNIDESLLWELKKEKRSISVSDSFSESYCDIEENVELKCVGYISLQIQKIKVLSINNERIDIIDMNEEISISNLINHAELGIDSVDEIEVVSL